MIANYIKIAIRNIQHHKVYSIINIVGLSVGMACTILILLWVQYELSFDRFHKNADRIYRLATNFDVGSLQGKWALSNFPAGPTLQKDYPEVTNVVRFREGRDRVSVEYQQKKFFEKYLFADNTIFDVFTFPLILGNPKFALSSPDAVVISENLAKKYFGQENPIGKILRLENKYDVKVTGVMKNLPPNSHITCEMLFSFEYLKMQPWYKKKMEHWEEGYFNYTYLLLGEGYNFRDLEKKFPALIQKHMSDLLRTTGGKIEYFLQPLRSIHLHSKLLEFEISPNGDIANVVAFTAIALFILLIACINFMYLSTARSASRTKEVGIRKVVGAHRGNLLMQFLGESFLLCFVSIILALGLVELSLPIFQSLSGSPLGYRHVPLFWLLAGLMGILLFTGFVSGCYPSLFLSAFKPIRILSGLFKMKGAGYRFRNILVVIQFIISITLIIGTGIAFEQIHYMKNKPLGFDKDHILTTRIIGESLRRSLELFKKELKRHSGIVNVAAASHIPSLKTYVNAYRPEGFTTKELQPMGVMSIDRDFINTIGVDIIVGRNFSSEITTDPNNAILINETAAKKFGWEDAVGKKIMNLVDEDDSELVITKTVIGVVRDFHMEALHNKIVPLYIHNNPDSFGYLTIKLRKGNIPQTMEFIKRIWKEYDPAHPFEFTFLDEVFDRQYKAEDKLSTVFFYFTLISILVACLGLFGLSAFTAERRTKEIGIRKALGASVSGIILMLSKEFTKWVLAANIIAWPIAYYAMNRWLQNFAYRVNISLGIFILAALLAFIIALLTVGYQAVKSARANPINSLRYE
jgi:putative ABC transport system permease protein